jgi:hypothetical protein
MRAIKTLLLIPLLIYNFAVSAKFSHVPASAAKSFQLVGFAQVDSKNPKWLEVKTSHGTYYLRRQAALMANRSYLNHINPKSEVVLKVDNSMIEKYDPLHSMPRPRR